MAHKYLADIFVACSGSSYATLFLSGIRSTICSIIDGFPSRLLFRISRLVAYVVSFLRVVFIRMCCVYVCIHVSCDPHSTVLHSLLSSQQQFASNLHESIPMQP
jgi:hypothetical protein